MDPTVPAVPEAIRVGSMTERIDNPFRITKSNDLTDEQIEQLWGTAGEEEDGLTGLARPSSPMGHVHPGWKGKRQIPSDAILFIYGVRVRSSIERLSQLFRVNRFSDKPIETSLIAFSVDEVRLDENARRVISLAQNTSLIINVPRGQRERNSEQVTSKLELNVMLAPRWDLPIARRGVVSFTPDEANAVFVFEQQAQFESILNSWEAKMAAPLFGRMRFGTNGRPAQTDLFE
jgi:hypothetical protein